MNYRTLATTGTAPSFWSMLLLLGSLLFATASQAGMGIEDAKHLLLRTGFSAPVAQVEKLAALSRQQAVDKLLNESRTTAVTPRPAWLDETELLPRQFQMLDAKSRARAVQDGQHKALQLRAWWFAEMLATPSPLTERMTLFWHNHFVSSAAKVKSNRLMFNQNVLLRREALGNFGVLLQDIARDPAMIVYLDSALNRKGKPNENFAREVMELFTLGEGNYSEQDIREAARAFTGWSLDRRSGEFRMIPPQHDTGLKTVFGHTGNWDGQDVLNMLLDHPQTARHISARLWMEFISTPPDKTSLEPMAKLLYERNYEIKPLLRALLLSDSFWSRTNRASMLKSPVEFLVGTTQTFQLDTGVTRQLAIASRQLGQDIFAPPNVKGWPGGATWITSATLLARHQFIERIFRNRGMNDRNMGSRAGRETLEFDEDIWLSALPGPESHRRRTLVETALARAPLEPLPPEDSARYIFARALALDPVYQLK